MQNKIIFLISEMTIQKVFHLAALVGNESPELINWLQEILCHRVIFFIPFSILEQYSACGYNMAFV